ncbi:uncharacterized protein PHALS_13428 [Plasmopara halstedii]|uniref:Uncharacterized protein n=1 Tax=Plasmopara halstedii TaxID=4781 RepID=A0A0P1APR9_PLAHL|nr:uncharacterized protein PHALS_13428 [Plasmopara halstedii]CEG43216.1 hypothetical protein PHALS_13428 [Plasmopara halstedii]|eukprot:XP_024579585.1 hypothetical protein PHALS_13428 [Plasmopara halstedii]
MTIFLLGKAKLSQNDRVPGEQCIIRLYRLVCYMCTTGTEAVRAQKHDVS